MTAFVHGISWVKKPWRLTCIGRTPSYYLEQRLTKKGKRRNKEIQNGFEQCF